MSGTRYARLLAGALFLLLPGIAAAQAQFGIVNNVGLSFGNLGTGPFAGTAILNPTTGAVTVTGGVVNLGGTQTAASFTVTVPPPGNPSFTIVLPTSATLTAGSDTMTVDTFTSNPPCCAGFGRSQVVTVGATLHVSANQAGGNYSGTATFIVTRP